MLKTRFRYAHTVKMDQGIQYLQEIFPSFDETTIRQTFINSDQSGK